jgi:hypothetical protein
LREVDETCAEQRETGDQDGLDAEPSHERLRDPRGHHRGQGDGEVADAGLQGGEAEHLLHVERE